LRALHKILRERRQVAALLNEQCEAIDQAGDLDMVLPEARIEVPVPSRRGYPFLLPLEA
jgi:hypothetical protein